MDMAADYQFQPISDHPVIEGVWSLTVPPGEDRIAPDTSCELIFHQGKPPAEQTDTGWQVQPRLMLYGPLTRALHLRNAASMTLAAIRLTPGGIGLLHAAPDRLRNASHPLDALLGQETTKELAKAAAGNLTALADTARARLARSETERSRRIEDARAIFAATPALSAGGLAEALEVSIRTLDRSFIRQTGLRPGEFIRIHRYHAARRAVKEKAAGLADIAADHGYADQAHMTREFQHFAGLTPRRKQAGEGLDVFYQDSTSSST